MTTANILTSLVGDDGKNFSATQKSTAITTAQGWLGTSDGDSNAKDTATALLAQKILLNMRKSADKQLSLDELVTDEIRSLMADDEKSKAYTIVHYKKPDVSWRT